MEVESLSFHRYELHPRTAPNRLSDASPRQGLLLKVRFRGLPDAGHADLFPWPELGDEPLHAQLEALKQGVPFSLGAASLCWAHYEARALAAGEALLDGTAVPSHATMPSFSPPPQGCTTAKLKIGKTEVAEWPRMEELLLGQSGVRWRLDFNGLFTGLMEARRFWEAVSPPARAAIEFVEDPMVADLMGDPGLKAVFAGTKVAVDRLPTPSAVARADLWVVKPVYFSPEHFFSHVAHFPREIVVTSNMDHPLGQLIALHAAQRLGKTIGPRLLAGGLMTHDLYAPHAQRCWVQEDGRCLKPASAGAGWGLAHAWDDLTWEHA